jgi:hypothetical protein
MDPLLLGSAPAHQRLLFVVEHPDQRRLRGARLLPARQEGLLHHVPGAQQAVLSGSPSLGGALLVSLVAGSIVAGWSARYGP